MGARARLIVTLGLFVSTTLRQLQPLALCTMTLIILAKDGFSGGGARHIPDEGDVVHFPGSPEFNEALQNHRAVMIVGEANRFLNTALTAAQIQCGTEGVLVGNPRSEQSRLFFDVPEANRYIASLPFCRHPVPINQVVSVDTTHEEPCDGSFSMSGPVTYRIWRSPNAVHVAMKIRFDTDEILKTRDGNSLQVMIQHSSLPGFWHPFPPHYVPGQPGYREIYRFGLSPQGDLQFTVFFDPSANEPWQRRMSCTFPKQEGRDIETIVTHPEDYDL